MANIAKLSVSLEADISKFERGMQKSSHILSAFNVNMASLAGHAVDAFAAAGVAAAAGLGLLVANTVESVTAQTRLADRLQISTTALAGFELAARGAGVDAETASGFLTHLTKAIGEAEGGSEEMQATFNTLGIDLVKFAGQSGDQKLRTIADAFHGIADAGTRADIAMKLGGRSGAQLVGVLSQGADGLDNATQRATDLGLALNRVDSAKVVEAHAAWEELKATFEGIITQLTVQLSPFITVLEKQFSEWATAGGGNVNAVRDAFEGLLTIIAEVSDFFSLLESAFYGVRVVGVAVGMAMITIFEGVAKAIEAVYNGVADITGLFERTDLSSGLDEIRRGLEIEAGDAAEAAERAWDDFSEGTAVKKVQKFFGDVRKDAEAAAKATAKGVEEAAQAGTESEVERATANADMAGQKARMKLMDEMQKKADALEKSLLTPLEKFRGSVAESMALWRDGFIDAEIFNRSLQKSTEDYISATQETKANTSFKEINTSLINIEGLKGTKNQPQEVKSSQLDVLTQVMREIKSALLQDESGGILVGA